MFILTADWGYLTVIAWLVLAPTQRPRLWLRHEGKDSTAWFHCDWLVKMVLPLFCRIWQNMSYMKGKETWDIKSGFFSAFFMSGNSMGRRKWDIRKWGKYYAALQSLFPPMSQMLIFSFSGTYSNFKIKNCGKIHSQSKYYVSQVHSVTDAS